MSRVNIEVADRIHPDLAEAVRRLVEKFQPERIYLFGSHARGNADEHNDYDIMVVIPESRDPGFRRAQAAYSVLWGLDISIEVIVVTIEEFEQDLPLIASLPATVHREGHLLYAV